MVNLRLDAETAKPLGWAGGGTAGLGYSAVSFFLFSNELWNHLHKHAPLPRASSRVLQSSLSPFQVTKRNTS